VESRATAATDGFLVCGACPRECRIVPGAVGFCGALQHGHCALERTHHGAPFSLRVTRIEASGLRRFRPGSTWTAVESPGSGLEGTTGHPHRIESEFPWMSAEQAVFLSRSWGCAGVYLDEDDPVFSAREGLDILTSARAAGMETALCTTGFLAPHIRERLFAQACAVSLHLLSDSPLFYRRRYAARFEPIRETVTWLRNHPTVHLEVTVPLIPEESDRFLRLVTWLREVFGASTPLSLVVDDTVRERASLQRALDASRALGMTDVAPGLA